MKKIGLFLFDICFALQMVAQEQNYFTNPVIRGDVPDPSVIRIEDTYYATGTSSAVSYTHLTLPTNSRV